MRKKIEFEINNLSVFKSKLLQYLEKFQDVAFFDNNSYVSSSKNNSFELLVSFNKISEFNYSENIFENLKNYIQQKNDWIFGYFSYDLKNDIENLKSENENIINFPKIYFFQAEFVIILHENICEIQYLQEYTNLQKVKDVFTEINLQKIRISEKKDKKKEVNIQKKINKTSYLQKIQKIKQHIKKGDIYELNFCQEFFIEDAEINPYSVFSELNKISPAPFSTFFRMKDKYLLSSSMERFLKKSGKKIISQPIKGTIKRGNSEKEDFELQRKLQNDPKERAENIMITDLVRNDLSRNAEIGSVKVEELCEIYKFEQVFQMISTISCNLHEKSNSIDIIKDCFPAGSMTGAPKIRAMQLIEKYEESKRGLYSGSVGYFSPQGDFDFNVVIRSILYNSENKKISFSVGGAITDKSDAKKEYDECLLKAKAIVAVLKT